MEAVKKLLSHVTPDVVLLGDTSPNAVLLGDNTPNAVLLGDTSPVLLGNTERVAPVFTTQLYPQLSSTNEYKDTLFKDILGNITRQRYHVKLRPQYQKVLHLNEEMFELVTSFNIPALYIRILCEREHRNLVVLKSLTEGFSSDAASCSVRALSRSNKITAYREELSLLGRTSGEKSFKLSENKGLAEWKWSPINLHAQVLEVTSVDSTSNEESGHDNYVLLTVGAMAGHWDKFKNRGLLSLLNPKSRDGEKFSERRKLYGILEQMETYSILLRGESASLEVVQDLLAISNDAAARHALEELQKTINIESQLEVMQLSVALERALKSFQAEDRALTAVCSKYCRHMDRAAVWLLAELELDNREHFLNLLNRYEACFSQLLSAAVSGFVVSLCFRAHDRVFQQQLQDGVVPIMFESLISTHGDEAAMLEDMWFVMENIGDISVQLEASDEEQVKVSRITGSTFAVVVTLSLPRSLFSLLPPLSHRIKFEALFFSHGINEQQTIAYKINETGLQERICEQFLEKLQNYVDKHVTPNLSLYHFKVSNGLTNNLEKLAGLYKHTKKGKYPDFIVMCEQIGRDIGCIRFTSCKSAKDRTSMSVTYEYCNILTGEHDLHHEDVPGVLEQFRRDGTRYYNTFKNIGSYKYCFNKLQCKLLPGIYRPPPGTFGDGAQHT